MPQRLVTVPRILRLLALAGLVGSLPSRGATASPALPPPPPAAAVHDVVELMHGVTVHDPYRDLEDLQRPATQAWLKAQGAYASAVLASLPERDALAGRIAELSRATGDQLQGLVRMPGERLFYLKRPAGQAQFKLMTRQGASGPERVLVDPEQLARERGGMPHAINYFVPSWDGRRVAYGLSAGGSEDASLHVLDVASGRAIGQPIPRVHEDLVHWTPDNQQLSYNQVRALPPGTPDTETYLDSTAFLIRVGQPERLARPLFGPLVQRDLGLVRLDVAGVQFNPGSRFMLARTTDTTVPEGRIFVAPLRELGQARVHWRALVQPRDGITDVQLHGDLLYLRTHQGAPRGRWLVLNLARGETLAQARSAINEPARGVLHGLLINRQGVHGEVSEGFNRRVLRFDRPDEPGQDVAPGQPGSTLAVPDPAHAHGDLLLRSSAWTAPAQILRSSGPRAPAQALPTLLQASLPPGLPALMATEVLVPSHDGAQVPLAILHRADLPRDGQRPTLLVGYGAYGFSFEARFNARNMAWLERGGVLAFANVRGSGAFGDAWHRAGFKQTKPNTWKDGIACAQYLVRAGYTRPASLGVWGTSAGGVFAGRALTEAPQQFGAAILDVGMMDAVRGELSANGITNISEFGTVQDPSEFQALLAMSPYHQVRDGVAYPGVLLIHGLNDPRVEVWNSAKMAARLQAASSSGKPVLLRLDAQAGHGIGSTATQVDLQLADLFSFLLWQFGDAPASSTSR